MTTWTPSIDYILVKEMLNLFEVQPLTGQIHTIAVIPFSMTSNIKFLWLGSIFLGVLPWTFRYFSFLCIPSYHLCIVTYRTVTLTACLLPLWSSHARLTGLNLFQFLELGCSSHFAMFFFLFPSIITSLFQIRPQTSGILLFLFPAWSLINTYIFYIMLICPYELLL